MKTTLPNGKEIKVINIDFETTKEDWNEYKLEDGTVLKFKAVVSSIVRTDNHDFVTGNPIYQIRSTNIVKIRVPEKLKRLPPKNNPNKKVSGMEVG